MKLSRRSFTSRSTAALVGAAMPNLRGLAAPRPPRSDQFEIHSGWDVSVDGDQLETGVTLPHTSVPLSWRNWQPAAWQKVWTYRAKVEVSRAALHQRLFLHVERALANAVVSVNGNQVGTHAGGFLPFECEITQAVRAGINQITIEVDSRWLDVPPSGSPKGFAAVDYYLPGMLGAVTIHQRPSTAVVDVWGQAADVVTGTPTVKVFAELDAIKATKGTLVAQLRQFGTVIAEIDQTLSLLPGKQTANITMPLHEGISLWSPDTPRLYDLVVSFRRAGETLHSRSTRIGLREARFELDGFYLNGKRTRLFGLNRHELFPYVGFAASPRAIRRDATYLRDVLNCNVVRCSHYPQSTAFLDACDDLGLMVWEEIPGWQYLGDAAWKEIAARNVDEMVRRDRNHPSIIVWGTRINESANDPELYRRTRDIAKQLDPTRPTSGSMTPSSRADWKEHWHEDVFAFDDYHAAPDGAVGVDPALPGVPYMLAEAVGQFSYGTARNFLRRYRRAGNPEEQNSQALLHAQVHDRAAQDERNAGVIAWCGFDYASPINAYEGVKCPGVVDTFRIPKLGASFYMAQVAPEKRVVIEPSFYWDATLHATQDRAIIFSNCDELHVFLNGTQIATVSPERMAYPKLLHPPFLIELPWGEAQRSVLRVDGYIAGAQRLSRSFDGRHENDALWIAADDKHINADGVDSTRISFGVCDRFGNTRLTAEGVLRVRHAGAGEMIGDVAFPLAETGAVGAIWLRGLVRQRGRATITIAHPLLKEKSVSVEIGWQENRQTRI